ncbi:MAG: hypothetical protein ABJM43_18090 [Paracoccaceae bacterium]
MLRLRQLTTLRQYTVLGAVLCSVLAVVVLGFVHARGSAPLSPELAAYIEMGGALSDICGANDPDALGGDDCPICRLSDAALGEPLSTLIDTQAMSYRHKIVAPDGAIVPSALCRAPPVRGPPLVI